MKTAVFFGLILGFAAPAFGGPDAGAALIECRVFGLLAGGSSQYKTLVEGSFQTNVRDIRAPNQAAVQKSEDDFARLYLQGLTDEEREIELKNTCIPVGLRSKLFGQEGGTRLQISAWRCHNNSQEPYFYSQVILNGLPVNSQINSSGFSRTSFNVDQLDDPDLVSAPSKGDLVLERSPVKTPEGVFEFIYSDCNAEALE